MFEHITWNVLKLEIILIQNRIDASCFDHTSQETLSAVITVFYCILQSTYRCIYILHIVVFTSLVVYTSTVMYVSSCVVYVLVMQYLWEYQKWFYACQCHTWNRTYIYRPSLSWDRYFISYFSVRYDILWGIFWHF